MELISPRTSYRISTVTSERPRGTEVDDEDDEDDEVVASSVLFCFGNCGDNINVENWLLDKGAKERTSGTRIEVTSMPRMRSTAFVWFSEPFGFSFVPDLGLVAVALVDEDRRHTKGVAVDRMRGTMWVKACIKLEAFGCCS